MVRRITVGKIIHIAESHQNGGELTEIFRRYPHVGHDPAAVVDLPPACGTERGDQRVRHGSHAPVFVPVAVIERLDTPPARRVIFRRGEFDVSVLADRPGRLHEAFSEAPLSDHHGAIQILQRSGHDLAGRSRGAVDQHDQRHRGRNRLSDCPIGGIHLGHPPAGRHDNGIPGDEKSDDLHRFAQYPAGIATQIEHQPAHRFSALLLQGVQGRPHLVRALLGKAVQPDISHGIPPDTIGDPAVVRHGRYGNPLALDPHRPGHGRIGDRRNHQGRHRPSLAPHPVAGEGDFPTGHIDAVNGQYPVAGFQSRPIGRRPAIRLSDLDPPPVAGFPNQGAQSGVFPGGHGLEIGHLFRGQVFGIRIEPFQHGIGGDLYDLLRRGGIDVIEVDFAKDIEEGLHRATDLQVAPLGGDRSAICGIL